MTASRPTLYRDAALADSSGPSLRKGVSLLVDTRRVVWIRSSSDEGSLPPNVRDGRKLAIDGLWALQFGHGGANNGPVDTLFFTAGPNDETDGLFDAITAA